MGFINDFFKGFVGGGILYESTNADNETTSRDKIRNVSVNDFLLNMSFDVNEILEPGDDDAYFRYIKMINDFSEDYDDDSEEYAALIRLRFAVLDVLKNKDDVEKRFILIESIFSCMQNDDLVDFISRNGVFEIGHWQATRVISLSKGSGVRRNYRYHMALLCDAELYFLEGKYAEALTRYYEVLVWDDMQKDLSRPEYEVKDLDVLYEAIIINIMTIYRVFGHDAKAKQVLTSFSKVIKKAKGEFGNDLDFITKNYPSDYSTIEEYKLVLDSLNLPAKPYSDYFANGKECTVYPFFSLSMMKYVSMSESPFLFESVIENGLSLPDEVRYDDIWSISL